MGSKTNVSGQAYAFMAMTPVKPGEELTVTLTAKQITPRGGADHGEVRWDAVVVNGEGRPVATYDVLTMVAKTWPPTL